MEKMLIFQLTETDKNTVKILSSNMKIKVLEIQSSDYRQALGDLAENKKSSLVSAYEGTAPEGSLMVFCNVTEKHMDKILFELRRKQSSITYKASLTPTNAKWNVLRMYMEMEKERKAFL